MSRTTERQQRERARRTRRRRAVSATVATLAVAAIVATGTLFATGVWGFGGGGLDAASVSSTRVSASATPSATPTPSATVPGIPAPAFTPEPPPPPAFDKAALSIDDPTSPWVVVNKLRPLQNGADYVPPDLVDLPADMPNPNGYQMRADAAASLEEMFHAALGEIGVQLVAQSGYRSYSVQVGAYDYYVNQLGTAGADLTSARPGFSEHQTGMAMDILDTVSGCSTDGRCFADTAAGQWLAANAYRFGWVLRYPDGGTPVTGYEFEPWHYRWVGVPLATEMHDTGVSTLEEFFGLPAAPDYAP
ncbi:M15 family metallopeptidase [Herbiconiux sp. CPCC 205763]|uniref:M15 family metallopeptidase n=1 Tax=Herbiconiux aconitum TaxID=2970913 RepID=A0ABT2GN00_9MICO|nr:M15 family metallopeptidase [Herbiconiux aconitum]MCS5717573.1 M15 family metallopeptidase [Herbiconiux aconitum]